MSSKLFAKHSIRFLAVNYLSGRAQRGISKAHYLSLAGISLGVLALLCVASVMNGFRSDIRNRIVGTYSDLRLSGKQGNTVRDYQPLAIKLQRQGIKVSPVIRNELLLKKGDTIVPCLSFGIDPDAQRQVSQTLLPPQKQHGEIIQGLVTGNLDSPAFAQGGIALGAGLAASLGVYLGDELQLLSPVFNLPTAFGMIPRVRYLKVQAIFAAGMPEYDQSYCYIPLQDAAFFASYADEVDYLELKVPHDRSLKHYQRQISTQFPQYYLEDWSAFDSSLYAAIRFEKFMMFVIMLFMYIIASFNLTGNLLKTISQKKRELGLLKALGLSGNDLQAVFLIQSILLCTIGIALGLGLGSILLLIQKFFGVIHLNMGDGSSIVLPVKLLLSDYLLITFVSYILTLLSVLLPLKRLNRIDAVQLIRRNV